MKIKNYFLAKVLLLLLFFSHKSYAQINNGDTLLKVKKEKKWKFESQIDQRNSFTNGNLFGTNIPSLPILGYAVGWSYKDKLTIGFGVYYAKSQNNQAYFIKWSPKIEQLAPKAQILGVTNKSYLVEHSSVLYYFTPRVEWTFLNSKWLDLGIPLEFGVGYGKLTLKDYFTGTTMPIIDKKGKVQNAEDVFFPVMGGLSGMINLTPDVGFQLGVGYRKIVKKVGISDNFDGLYYQLGLQLFPGNILRELKKDYKKWKKEKKERKEAQKSN